MISFAEGCWLSFAFEYDGRRVGTEGRAALAQAGPTEEMCSMYAYIHIYMYIYTSISYLELSHILVYSLMNPARPQLEFCFPSERYLKHC